MGTRTKPNSFRGYQDKREYIAQLLKALTSGNFKEARNLSQNVDFPKESLSLIGGLLAPAYLDRPNYAKAALWVLENANLRESCPHIELFGYAALGKENKVKELLNLGTNPYTKTWEGYDILFTLIMREKDQPLALILNHPATEEKEISRALAYCCQYGNPQCLKAVLDHFPKKGKMSWLQQSLLKVSEAPFNAKDHITLLAKKLKSPDLLKCLKRFESRILKDPHHKNTHQAIEIISRQLQKEQTLEKIKKTTQPLLLG